MEVPKKAARSRKSKSQDEPSPKVGEMPVVAESGPYMLQLPADLRISTAAAIYGEFRAINSARPFMIDASRVAKIDAAGLQAVVAGLHLHAHSGNWTWHEPSEVFVRAARLLGLHQTMALPAC